MVDTPGPNNSRDPEHKAATYRMLSESSEAVVLYILNATQLSVDDDARLLKHVADSMKVKGKHSKDRFIFVINLDDFKNGEDSVVAAMEKVRDYLKDNGIENANIYPASALTALNIRTILAGNNGEYDEDDIDEAELKVRKFNRNEEMHFEQYAPLLRSVKKEIQSRLEKARSQGDKKAEALIHCGIVPVEMAIQLYVRKYAKTAKIKNIVDRFALPLEITKGFEEIKKNIMETDLEIKKGFEELKKNIMEEDMVLKQELQELEECAKDNQDVERMIDELQRRIDESQRRIDESQRGIDESQGKLDWLGEIQDKVNSILDI